MQAVQDIPATPSAELCGCTVDCALSEENSTYLAIGPGGRGVVLKKLDPDCLWENALHPTVKDRLARVRELAHPGVANLLAVMREGEDAYLMWEYVAGVPFDEYLADPAHSTRELISLARELILTVNLLHAQGIVHGSLIGGNVIVTPSAAVRLTHVSPLLFIDFAVDIDCVVALLSQIVEQRGESDSPVGRLLAEALEQRMGLQALGTRLANLLDTRNTSTTSHNAEPVAAPRKRAVFGAALAAVTGLATVLGVWYAVEHADGPPDASVPVSLQPSGR